MRFMSLYTFGGLRRDERSSRWLLSDSTIPAIFEGVEREIARVVGSKLTESRKNNSTRYSWLRPDSSRTGRILQELQRFRGLHELGLYGGFYSNPSKESSEIIKKRSIVAHEDLTVASVELT
jgi:hypothetical protein